MIPDDRLAEYLKRAPQVLRELDRLDAEDSLYDFTRIVWPLVEPARPFVGGWHIEALCAHLEAVTDGEINRLLWMVPPGAMKSLTTNVFWPAWEWGPQSMASMRYLGASYSQALTVRDNIRFRQLIMGDLYQGHWSDRFQISEQQFSKIKLANDKTGWKLATSVGGIGTGERGDRVIVDDPHNVVEGESEAVRESTLQWFFEAMPTRLNDPEKSAIIVIMQRVHENDVAGAIMARDLGYTVGMFPMEYDSSRHCVTSIGFEDPRSDEAELIWPERMPREVVDRDKKVLGPYAAAAQFQQMPAPRGGGIIKRDWWQMWPPEGQETKWFRPLKNEAGDILQDDEGKPRVSIKYPEMEYILGSVDTAFKLKEENDYSAMGVWGLFLLEIAPGIQVPKVLLMEAWKARLPFHELVERVMRTCRAREVDALLIEDKASGQSVVQEIQRIMSSPRWVSEESQVSTWTTVPINPDGDKVARAHSIVPMFTNQMVFAPADDQFRPWAEDVISEVAMFPRGTHDDYVDMTSMALRYLRKLNLAQLASERQADDIAARNVNAMRFGAEPAFGEDVGGF